MMTLIKKQFLFLAILALLFSCGSNQAKIYIYTPVDGTGNPYDTMKSFKDTSSLYFAFIELKPGFTNLNDTTGGDKIWYPPLSGMGISPFKTSFDLDGAAVQEGKFYKVELWGKNDFNSTPFQYYGCPDCPFVLGGKAENRVNLCFGTYDPSSCRVCSGMTPFTQCVY